MPVSGRRHQALQQSHADLLAENGRLLQELREMTAERDERDDVLLALSARPEAVREPLGPGYVPASYLRASEAARALLADRLDLLQQANMSLPAVAA